jgi:uncharacterized protein
MQMDVLMPDLKKNIAIIGAGTGLTTAWLLEEHEQFNVHVFEKQERLGGHINSVDIEVDGRQIVEEGGAEFIGPSSDYTNVHRLFNHLKVKLIEYNLNSHFENCDNDEYVVLPPLYNNADGWIKYPFFCSDSVQKAYHLDFHTLLFEINKLLKLNELINQAKSKLLDSSDVLTLEAFISTYTSHKDDTEFLEQFFYPFVAAGWGVAIEDVKQFCAHYAMQYLMLGDKWFHAVDGLSTYIDTMAKQCTRSQIHTKTEIVALIPINVDGQDKYQLQKSDDSLVCDKMGQPILFDDVVISTPAFASAQLLSKIDNEDITAIRDKLSKVEYFDTEIVIHQDMDYASKFNTVVHTRFEKGQAANTMCKDWLYPDGSKKVFKTWVLPGQNKPNNILQTFHYRHPKIDVNYYQAQQVIHLNQGVAGIFHAGILAGGSDSHESGITAAIDAACKVCIKENALIDLKRMSLFPEFMALIIDALTEKEESVLSPTM